MAQGNFVTNYQDYVARAKSCIECRLCERKCQYGLETVNLLSYKFLNSVTQY